MSEELIVIPNKLMEVVDNPTYKGLSKAETIASGYAPFMQQVNDQIAKVKTLEKGNPEHVKIAYRIRLDCGKICSAVKDQKKKDKDSLLVQTRFIDALNNAVEGAARLTQGDAEEIEKHFEKLEEQRKDKIEVERKVLLSKFDHDGQFVDLRNMNDEAFKIFLSGTEAQYIAKIEAEKRAEKERVEAEKKAEEERIAKEKAEAEAREKIRKENEELKAAAIERDRLQKIEDDKRAKIEAARLLKEEKEREEQEAKLKAARDEKQRIEKELADKKAAEEKAEADYYVNRQLEVKNNQLAAKDMTISNLRAQLKTLTDLINEKDKDAHDEIIRLRTENSELKKMLNI